MTAPLKVLPVFGTNAPIPAAGTVCPVTVSMPMRTPLTMVGVYWRGAFARL